MSPPCTRVPTAVLALAVAIGVLAGPAAADPGAGDAASPLDGSELAVDVDLGPGDAGVECTGDPVGEHTCDKTGNLTVGPLVVDYEGFNDGNLAGGAYAFSDDFVFDVAGQSLGLNVTCVFETPPAAENPCPVEPTAP